MKRFSVLLALIMLFSCFSVSISGEEQMENNFTWTLTDGVLTIEGNGKITRSEWGNGIEKIIISEGITEIGENAFSGCTAKEIEIANTVTSISSGAFSFCANITEVVVPSSVFSIGSFAFTECTNLKNVIFAEGLESIGTSAFEGCFELKNAELPNSLKVLESYAFSECSIDTVYIPDNVESISNYSVWLRCPVNEIVVSDNNKKYHSNGNCIIETEAKKLIVGCNNSSIPNDGSVETISSCAFQGCVQMSSIVIPSFVKKIEYAAFSNCENLQAISLPDFAEIERDTFGGCKSLKEIKIPKGTMSLGQQFLDGCESLTKISLPRTIKTIEFGSIRNCTALEELTIPDSVTTLSIASLYGCDNLKNIYIPESVTEMAECGLGKLYGGSKSQILTIHGIKGSAAEKYALENGFDFKTLDVTKHPEFEFFIDPTTNFIPNAKPNTPASFIKETFIKSNISISISDSQNVPLENDDSIGTGCHIKFENGAEYTVVITADTDGSGTITATDYMQVKSMFLDMSSLDGVYRLAADTNKDGVVNSTDYLQIKSHLLRNIDLHR